MARAPKSSPAEEAAAPVADWRVRTVRPDESFSPPGPGPMMEHDPEWLLAIRHPGHGEVLLAEKDERYLPIQVHDGALSFVLGGIAVRRIDIRRHVLTGNLPDWSREDLIAILRSLRGHLGRNGVVFLIGVVENEPLWQALQDPELRCNYRVLQSGATDARRTIRLGADFDEYLASIPRNHRKDLKRRENRFEREFGGQSEVRVLTGQDEIKRFLEEVAPVSRRTYQSRLLKLGVGPGGALERQLVAAANRGQARCYGLYVDGEVIAWRIGFLFKGRYFSHHVGFDPDYAAWTPGLVLHIKSIRDFASLNIWVEEIDLLHGDNPAKRKLANAMRREGKFYLFPRTWRGTAQYLALKWFNAVSDGLTGIASRLGIREWARKRLRQR
ncbi:GNAT family N-acetyltransferase [Thioalkalivibrio sp. ALJ24]|uniref:GNAT family N-acetyltransferase n=1 Tax=Thioalkalivibrio sp. ALJ24 TaxID=545276 RepID=UPI000476AB04|nr:GNAT family N-acetyltransferase [Thioalkalivibrio sp. ALJ24]